MKARDTKNGKSLQFTKSEWIMLGHLIKIVWNNYDVSSDDMAFTILSDLMDITEKTK